MGKALPCANIRIPEGGKRSAPNFRREKRKAEVFGIFGVDVIESVVERKRGYGLKTVTP